MSTRQLDAQIAQAVGWHNIYTSPYNGELCGWPAGENEKWTAVSKVPHWQTDWSSFPKLLSWLNTAGFVTFERRLEPIWWAKLETIAVASITAGGDTMLEAASNLVLAARDALGGANAQ